MARTQNLLGVWGANGATVIPPTPAVGTTYRNTSLTQVDVENAWPYKEVVDSAKFNQALFDITTILKSAEERGVMEWNGSTTYVIKALAYGSDDVLYQALQAGILPDPSVAGTRPGNWKQALVGEMTVVANIAARDALVDVTTGQHAYVSDADSNGNPQIQVYNGSSWVTVAGAHVVSDAAGLAALTETSIGEPVVVTDADGLGNEAIYIVDDLSRQLVSNRFDHIDANLSLYIDPAGNDTTGTGSASSPWLTINKAYSWLSTKSIDQTATVSITINAGSHSMAGTQVIEHPQSENIVIVGVSSPTLNCKFDVKPNNHLSISALTYSNAALSPGISLDRSSLDLSSVTCSITGTGIQAKNNSSVSFDLVTYNQVSSTGFSIIVQDSLFSQETTCTYSGQDNCFDVSASTLSFRATATANSQKVFLQSRDSKVYQTNGLLDINSVVSGNAIPIVLYSSVMTFKSIDVNAGGTIGPAILAYATTILGEEGGTGLVMTSAANGLVMSGGEAILRDTVNISSMTGAGISCSNGAQLTADDADFIINLCATGVLSDLQSDVRITSPSAAITNCTTGMSATNNSSTITSTSADFTGTTTSHSPVVSGISSPTYGFNLAYNIAI